MGLEVCVLHALTSDCFAEGLDIIWCGVGWLV